MENEQTTSTNEVDTDGGWLITHWTKTWDTRVALTQIDNLEAQAQRDADAATAKLTEIQATKVQLKADIDAAVAKQAQIDAIAIAKDAAALK